MIYAAMVGWPALLGFPTILPTYFHCIVLCKYPTWPLYVVRPGIGVVVEPDMIINDLEKFWGLGDTACLQLGPDRHI